MSNTLTLTANVADVEVLAALFEDKARHSDIVADHQRGLGNEEAADRANARAQMLRTVAQPLTDLLAERKRVEMAERAERKAQADADREAKRSAKEAKRVAELNAKREAKMARTSIGDEIRAKATKKQKATA